MKAILAVLLSIGGLLLVTAITGMASDEIRGQLDRIPFALLRLARLRVPRELRVCLYDEEWQPELHHIMHRAETRPISRLVIGTLFALGILRAARRISRQRAKLAAPDIELRRLISLSAAVDALGNIATGVAGYAFTFAIGFTVGLGLITVLGIATPVLWLPMRVFLFLVFGIGPGLAFGFVASLGFRAAFRYLITPTKLRWVNNAIALAPNRSIRVLSAFADLFTAVNGVVRIPGMVAAISWPVGAALGLFAFLSVERMVGSVLVVVAFVIVISVAVRIFLVIPLRWLNQRRRLRPDNPSD